MSGVTLIIMMICKFGRVVSFSARTRAFAMVSLVKYWFSR